MTQTVATSSTTYITAAEVLKRLDWRVLADLCSDNESRIGGTSSSALLTNANFLALLRDASGELESACKVGERYSVADLALLIADSGMGAGKIYRLLCRLIMGYAFERRPDKENKQAAVYEAALKELDQLRDGERIFSFAESATAGRMNHEVETESDIVNRHGVVYQARRLFGRRSTSNDDPRD